MHPITYVLAQYPKLNLPFPLSYYINFIMLVIFTRKKEPYTKSKRNENWIRNTVYISPYGHSIIWTPLYYGQFVWSQKCQKSYIPYLYNMDTSVKRTLGSVPLVSILTRGLTVKPNNNIQINFRVHRLLP